jgi:serine/threonine protein kinase
VIDFANRWCTIRTRKKQKETAVWCTIRTRKKQKETAVSGDCYKEAMPMLQPDTLIQNRYVIKQQIGQGGMGAVYLALDQRFHNDVALKHKTLSTPETDDAFAREARLLHTLRHSALPRVMDYFSDDQGQYLVMEFIPGEDLHTILAQHSHVFPVHDVLRWADELLDALEYLHKQNPPVIHRDIKPRNLKLTADGEIILLDFGLAKGGTTQQTQTASGKSIKFYTPEYAPIEQIQGSGTTPQSDLYALAATLYHLVTGTPPEDALTRTATLASGDADPLWPPHEINPSLPVPISNVLMQALAIRADARPATARALRIALKADTQQQPAARQQQQPGGHTAYEGATRNVPQMHSQPKNTPPDFHDAQTVRVPGMQQPSQSEQTSSPRPSAPASSSPPSPPSSSAPVSSPPPSPPSSPAPSPSPATDWRDNLRQRDRNRWILPAVGAVLVTVLLCGFMAFVIGGNRDAEQVAEASPSPTMTMTASPESTATPTPAITDTPVPTSLPVITVAPPPTLEPVITTMPEVPAVGNVIRPDNVDQMSPAVEWGGHWDDVKGVAFAPDQQMVASASGDDNVQIWRIDGSEVLPPLQGHEDDVTSVAFSPDGQIVASGSDDERVRLWRVNDGSLVRMLEGHEDDILSIAFSPDGQLLASASLDRTVRIWGVTDGSLRDVLSGEDQQIYSVAFSPDGQTLAFGQEDGVVKLWQVGQPHNFRVLAGHTDRVNSLAFSSDGGMLVSGSADESTRLWRVSSGEAERSFAGHSDAVLSVALSPDGQLLATGSKDTTVRLWRVSDGALLRTIEQHTDDVRGVAFSADGRVLASASEDDTVQLWRVAP